MYRKLKKHLARFTGPTEVPHRRKAVVFVEYILLVTLVGLGVLVGLACVRNALVNELKDLADAINAINC